MNSSNIFSSILKREIIQILFRPTLDWYDDMVSLATPFEPKFDEWRAKGGNITLFSPKDKRALEIYSDHITFVCEGDIDSDFGFKQVSNLINEITKNYSSVKMIRRVACRRTYVYGSDFNFSDLTDLLYKKLFNSNKDLLSIHNGKIKDLAYIVDTIDNGCTTHVQTGAVKKEESINNFSLKFATKKLPEDDNNLFFDTDIFISENLNVKNILENLVKVYDTNHQTVKKYLDFLSK